MMYQGFKSAFQGGDQPPNHFLMGYKVKLWTISVKIGVSEAIRLVVPKFVNDVPRVSKCIMRWGSTPNHFFMGF